MILKIVILTISDSVFNGERQDKGGDELEALLTKMGYPNPRRAVLPDELGMISDLLREWCDEQVADLIFTTGGTGLGARDVTPQATGEIADYQVPGMAEALRQASTQITPFAMLSRGIVAVRARTLMVNLPGNPKAAGQMLPTISMVLPHAIEVLQQPRTNTHPV